MKLIAGLGNPGPRYRQTRHNVGFDVIEELARRWKIAGAQYDRDFEALKAEAQVDQQRVLLIQPQTLMNLSGRSVQAAARFFKIERADVLVVYDDMDLPVGQVRVRADGSAGGHKGMADVIQKLSSSDIPRVRIGIGRVHRDFAVDYVLSRFDPQERQQIDAAIGQAADAAECWLKEGTTAAMNRFNRRATE